MSFFFCQFVVLVIEEFDVLILRKHWRPKANPVHLPHRLVVERELEVCVTQVVLEWCVHFGK